MHSSKGATQSESCSKTSGLPTSLRTGPHSLRVERRAGSRAGTRVIPRSGGKHRPDRRREDAVAPRLAEKFPCRSVTGTPPNLIGVEKADRDINRDNVEIRSTVEDTRQGGYFPNDRSAGMHHDDGPTARGAVDASDMRSFCINFDKRHCSKLIHIH